MMNSAELQQKKMTESGQKRDSRIGRWQKSWNEMGKNRWAYVFISPFYILFIIFGLYPLLFSFVLSFTEWKGRGPLEFVGLANYQLMLKDKVFWQSVENGIIIFLLYVPLMTFLALVLAVILNSPRIRGYRIFRLLIFMPYITNMVAAGFIFQLILNEKVGLINLMLQAIHLPAVPWLNSMWGARVSLAMLVTWAWLGYNMIIMLAGLQTIDETLIEAAMIDGASRVRAFFSITVPLMRPVIAFSVILSTIGSFALFTELVSLFPQSQGTGPLNATITPLLAVFKQTFNNFRFGYASALAYSFFALIFIVTILQFRFFDRGEE